MRRSLTSSYFGAERATAPRGWVLAAIAPTIVGALGVAIAVVVGFVGVGQLYRATDAHAQERADVLAGALSARLDALTPEGRRAAIELAARRSGAELMVVESSGAVIQDATARPLSPTIARGLLQTGRGRSRTSLGSARFSARPVGGRGSGRSLIVFVHPLSAEPAARASATALAALVILLVGTAAAFAYAVSRDVEFGVGYLTERIGQMASLRIEPTGEPVPVRTVDEIGVLTGAFNDLVGRFAEAERLYRENLRRADDADRDRAAFLATVSHELRSPLNAILGFADVLLAEVDGPLTRDAREEIEQIRESGQHLSSLINDILELSALEGGQLHLALDRVDVRSVAEGVIKEASALTRDGRVALSLEGAEPVFARADARRVRQILTNLVGNAVKFTEEGDVVVQISKHGGYARVSVRDSGPGISEAERVLIFDEYRQTRDESRRHRGTGLGLAIARRLAVMHRGAIVVDSAVGRGSTFDLLLPLWTIEDDARRDEKRKATEERRARRMRGRGLA